MSRTCVHGVPREFVIRDEITVAFVENCAICLRRWKEGGDQDLVALPLAIGVVFDLKEAR